jgi:hypothetical protein
MGEHRPLQELCPPLLAERERNNLQEDVKAQPPEKKNRRYTVRLFGTNSLKEGAM